MISFVFICPNCMNETRGTALPGSRKWLDEDQQCYSCGEFWEKVIVEA